MPFGLFRSQKYVQLFSWQRKNHRMFLWLHRCRLYHFRLYLAQKGFAKESIDQRKLYKHETSGEKRKEGGVARLAEGFGGKSACFSVFLSRFE